MADRTVHVHNCAPVFRHELHGSVQTRLRRVRIGVLPDDLVSAFGNDLRRKRGNVGKMVIKRVAVDAAVLYDCLDRDLIERSTLSSFRNEFLRALLGVSGHSLTSCAAA